MKKNRSPKTSSLISPTSSLKRKTRTRFTLVELLIVVAIIAILAGMLLPALRGALRQGKIISCTGNQKQIAFGLSNYATDNKEWFPMQGYTGRIVYHVWHRALLAGGYLGRPMTEAESYDFKKRGTTVMICPEDTPPYYSVSLSVDDFLSYGINGMIAWTDTDIGTSKLKHYIPRSFLVKGRKCNNPNHDKSIQKSPSGIALTADNFKANNFQPWASTSNSPWDPTVPRCIIGPRHTIGAVFSFADGHAGFFKFPFSANCLNPEEKLGF